MSITGGKVSRAVMRRTRAVKVKKTPAMKGTSLATHLLAVVGLTREGVVALSWLALLPTL
jgi:hypothetical protein